MSETLRVEHYFFPNFGRISTKIGRKMHSIGRWVPLDLLFLLYYQCKSPSIIVRQHDQGASNLYDWHQACTYKNTLFLHTCIRFIKNLTSTRQFIIVSICLSVVQWAFAVSPVLSGKSIIGGFAGFPTWEPRCLEVYRIVSIFTRKPVFRLTAV